MLREHGYNTYWLHYTSFAKALLRLDGEAFRKYLEAQLKYKLCMCVILCLGHEGYTLCNLLYMDSYPSGSTCWLGLKCDYYIFILREMTIQY